MKTIKMKLKTGYLFILLLVAAATANQGYSQFVGLYTYMEQDSVPGGPLCINDPVDGYIQWYNTGIYMPGDYVDINVDWGDGNNSSYAGTPIISGGSYGYINPIYPSHIYTLTGSYTVIITSMDNYGSGDADTFQLNLSNLCGDITTQVYLDNGNGVYDWNDVGMPGVGLNLTSPSLSYFTTTSAFGYASINNIDINTPSYVLEVDPAFLASTGMTVIQPAAGNYNVTGLGNTAPHFDFLLDCGAQNYHDGSVYGFGWGFRAGLSDGYATISIYNSSCNGTPVSMNISLDFDPILTVFNSTLPGGTIVGNNISWTGVNIPLGYTNFRVYFTVPGATPAFTPLPFHVDITTTNATDVYAPNNSYDFISEVRNSWDPNDKNTDLPHLIDVNVQEEIAYTIRFQNMGNDDALNIHIVDTISNLLDLSTFKVLGQSHAGSYSIDPVTREVIFTFPGINLVPQSVSDPLSQGFITYSIKENPGLPLNSDIHNTAHIFFDQNPAVVTNTTSNINVTNPAGVEENALSSVTIYPVPADNYIHIGGISTEDISGVKILDLNGKVIEAFRQGMNPSIIPVKHLTSGFYLVEIQSGENSIVRKICVQH